MMELRVSSDFGRLVKAFEAMPEETQDMVRRQLKMAVRDVREYARDNHRFVTRSGKTEKSIASKADDNKGVVWLDSPVAVYQHEGTREHKIEPRNKQALRWVSGNKFVFARRVTVGGIEADPYLYTAAEECEPAIVNRFAAALEELLGRL